MRIDIEYLADILDTIKNINSSTFDLQIFSDLWFSDEDDNDGIKGVRPLFLNFFS